MECVLEIRICKKCGVLFDIKKRYPYLYRDSKDKEILPCPVCKSNVKDLGSSGVGIVISSSNGVAKVVEWTKEK